MKRNTFMLLLAGPAFGIILSLIYMYYLVAIWGVSHGPQSFEIKPGDTFSKINYRLDKNELISNARLFHRLSQYKKITTKLRPGTYEIERGSTMLDLMELFQKGNEDLIRVTIPEGKNLYEIAKIFASKNICSEKDFINFALSTNAARDFGIEGETFEGYLYPETYLFPKNTDVKVVIKKMVEVWNEKLKEINLNAHKLTPHEVVTLASIVEKETGAGWERPKIAGVFFNRLKKRMRLQSDPTTIYGLYPNFNGNLRKKHLLEKTPYNTYKISGLPIGPISNPGLAAIKAVIEPEQHSYLYFVSHNDGTHYFSKTYKEHLKAVEKFQKNSSARKGKSWRDLKQKN